MNGLFLISLVAIVAAAMAVPLDNRMRRQSSMYITRFGRASENDVMSEEDAMLDAVRIKFLKAYYPTLLNKWYWENEADQESEGMEPRSIAITRFGRDPDEDDEHTAEKRRQVVKIPRFGRRKRAADERRFHQPRGIFLAPRPGKKSDAAFEHDMEKKSIAITRFGKEVTEVAGNTEQNSGADAAPAATEGNSANDDSQRSANKAEDKASSNEEVDVIDEDFLIELIKKAVVNPRFGRGDAMQKKSVITARFG